MTSYADPLPLPPPCPPDPSWRWLEHGWPQTTSAGWRARPIAEEFSRSWGDFLERLGSPAPLGPGIDGGMVDDLPGHNIVLAFAYSIALAAHRKRRIDFLDWGGGVGHFGVIARAVLPRVEVRYVCKDVPENCRRGREQFREAVFCADESWKSRTYDFTMASGSLQYVEDWRSTLEALAAATRGYLLIHRLPIVSRAPSFVVAQRAYGVELPSWVLNRDEFLAAASEIGLTIEREFLILEAMGIAGAPERFRWRGFLFST
jgi:putative methyltransferase (TIGR04325 family)